MASDVFAVDTTAHQPARRIVPPRQATVAANHFRARSLAPLAHRVLQAAVLKLSTLHSYWQEMNMKHTYVLTHAILWAVAIIVSAAAGASTFFSLILLPSLAAISLLVARARHCLKRDHA